MALLINRRAKFLGMALVFAVLTSGCSDYLNNWDTVSYRAGDASYANSAIQQIDPRPSSAYLSTVGSGG